MKIHAGFHETPLACASRRVARSSRTMPQLNRGFTLTWLGHNTFRLKTRGAKTVLWNGPMGMFEDKRFAEGTNVVARAVVDATQKNGAKTIIGGGDSVKALNKAGLGDKVTFMSTGGGASLEFLEGKELPGVAALTDK